jgi:hypothetical protein
MSDLEDLDIDELEDQLDDDVGDIEGTAAATVTVPPQRFRRLKKLAAAEPEPVLAAAASPLRNDASSRGALDDGSDAEAEGVGSEDDDAIPRNTDPASDDDEAAPRTTNDGDEWDSEDEYEEMRKRQEKRGSGDEQEGMLCRVSSH